MDNFLRLKRNQLVAGVSFTAVTTTVVCLWQDKRVHFTLVLNSFSYIGCYLKAIDPSLPCHFSNRWRVTDFFKEHQCEVNERESVKK